MHQTMKSSDQSLEVDLDLIRRLDRNGPRYTSYPTADRFVEAFDGQTYAAWAQKRGLAGRSRPLSLYFHLPFCNTLCYFCACNKIVTKDKSLSVKYVDYLIREMQLQSALFGERAPVSQLHWGGGTPTFLPPEQMERLMAATRQHFHLQDDAEISIEIDPRKVDEEIMAVLGHIGFNRISVGVQDFDPTVQKAVNRIQSLEQTRLVIEEARRHDAKSVNVDLIYGLPHQSLEGFTRTLDQVIELSPDRMSIYNYAHMPALFKPQRRIQEEDLPSPDMKLELLKLAIRKLTDAGYVYIGMDHFAKASDELTIAQQQGRLQRNFQGYSTHADCDLVAMGISAIGKVGPTYSQNVKTLDEYYDRLDRGELPIMRGIQLSMDDLLRRTIIQALMCQFELSLESVQISYLIDFKEYFARELEQLREYEREGMLTLDDKWLVVTPKGRLLIRNICMVFDQYLQANQTLRNYSKVI